MEKSKISSLSSTKSETPLSYIDLFAGCGGLSLGLHSAGWKGLFAIEKSPFAFATLKHNLIHNLNHFCWPEWLEKKEHDINEVLKNKQKELQCLKGFVDLIVGGPPCQGFSSAGRRRENDHRNGLIHSYIKFIRIVQPKMIFFENVKGFTQSFQKNKSKGINYSEFVEKALKRSGKKFIGYEVQGKLIDFAEYGVPQKRTRFILVGVRKDLMSSNNNEIIPFFEILKNRKIDFLANKGLNLTQSLKDSISDLLEKNGKIESPDSKGFFSAIYGKVESNFQILMRNNNKDRIPDSHRFANHSNDTIEVFQKLILNATKGKKIEADLKKKYNVKKRSLLVLDPNKPAPTLTSHPDDYIHYCEPRILSVREYARVQTFPDWFEFKEKYTTGGKLRTVEVPRYTQIGNAIPPLFGEQVGNALISMIKNG